MPGQAHLHGFSCIKVQNRRAHVHSWPSNQQSKQSKPRDFTGSSLIRTKEVLTPILEMDNIKWWILSIPSPSTNDQQQTSQIASELVA